MARHLFCFMSLILVFRMAVVSSASELDNGYIPKPENSIPDNQPKQQDNGNPVDSPTNFNIPIKSEPKPKVPVTSPSPGHKKPKYNHPLPIYKKPFPTPLPVHKKKPIYKKPIYIPKPVYIPIYKNPTNDTPAQAPAPAPTEDDYPVYPPPSPSPASSSSSPLPPSPTQSPTNGAPPPYKSLDYIPAPVFDPPINEPSR